MAFRIVGSFKGTIDCKRFYLPGIQALDECPRCNRTIEWSADRGFALNYPKTRERLSLQFYCEDCDYNWGRPVELEVNLLALSGEREVQRPLSRIDKS